MAHPYHHSLSSVRKWGGTVDDYIAVHSWFDASKQIIADFRHRALRHHAEGIFMAETVFGQTLTLQGANVKMWVAAITTASIYVRPGHTLADTAVVTAVFSAINLPVMFVWAGGGAGLRRFLGAPGRIRVFNFAMGTALAASVVPLL